jgi:glycosyltransferase involved in cell wall biosynthesis
VKILVVHNGYQRRGGEDAVREAEVSLLREAGHDVSEFLRCNDEIRGYSFVQKLSLGCSAIWSQQSYRELRDVLLWEAPDVAHFHNTFPLISPAAHYACADAGVPVVQTLHNYRLLCPGANFLRDGRVCEECLGRSVPWPGVLHECYRGSRMATASVAVMLTVHRSLRTWWNKVGVFIALTEFAKQKHIEGGLPGERMVVKPNFLQADPRPRTAPGEYAMYVGRLSEEKGVRVLLDAWSRLNNTIPLVVVGEGPLAGELREKVDRQRMSSVSMLGALRNQEVLDLLQGARFLVLPSVCFEGFPMTVVEAFACGVPVIASGHGGAREIIHDGFTGLHAIPGNAEDLASKVEWAWRNEQALEEMGRAARAEFESKYTAKDNYRRLLEIYEQALATPS